MMKSCLSCEYTYTDCRGYIFCTLTGAIGEKGFGYLGRKWDEINSIPKWCPKKDNLKYVHK